MQIAFTTYSTPAWTPLRIALAAAALGYDAVELRAYNGANVPATLTPAECAELRRTFSDHGLAICAVGTSCRFSPSEEEAAKGVADAGRYLRIASELGAPLIRVFGGAFDRERVSEEEAVERVARSLGALAQEARHLGVKVALETHDGFSAGALVGRALRLVAEPQIGACWDWLHPCRVGESPAETAGHLRGLIVHAHTKDARRNARGGWEAEYFGEGELPLSAILAEMVAQGYAGPLSLEWERGGDPEPEKALSAYAPAMRALVRAGR